MIAQVFLYVLISTQDQFRLDDGLHETVLEMC